MQSLLQEEISVRTDVSHQ